MPQYAHWLLKIKDHIATLTLNRPEVKNRIDNTTLLELEQISLQLDANPEVWVILLKASGSAFSAGVDVSLIGGMIDNDDATFAKKLSASQQVLDTFEAIDKPTIAALHGYVVGGGLILALCCDFRIAADNTIVSLPEVKRSIGVIMGTQRITRTIGVANTKELVMLANPIDANKGMHMGLFTKVVGLDALENEVQAMADQLLKLPPLAVGLCKKIINEGQFLDRSGQDLEIEAQAALLKTDDFKEAISSFFEKRKPEYKGH